MATELGVSRKTVNNELGKKLETEDFTQPSNSASWFNVLRFGKCDPNYGTDGHEQ